MSVVTTKRRPRCAQPPRLGVRRASPAAPRGARPASAALGDDLALREGKERCIQNELLRSYILCTSCTTCVLLGPRCIRCRVSGSEWSEVRGPKSGVSRYRFQHSRNRYVTPVCWLLAALELQYPFCDKLDDKSFQP